LPCTTNTGMPAADRTPRPRRKRSCARTPRSAPSYRSPARTTNAACRSIARRTSPSKASRDASRSLSATAPEASATPSKGVSRCRSAAWTKQKAIDRRATRSCGTRVQEPRGRAEPPQTMQFIMQNTQYAMLHARGESTEPIIPPPDDGTLTSTGRLTSFRSGSHYPAHGATALYPARYDIASHIRLLSARIDETNVGGAA
jgi:hypothetical protein